MLFVVYQHHSGNINDTLLLTVNSCPKTPDIQWMLTANVIETVERCLRLSRWRAN